MHPEKITEVYFIGIGGIGMSALARFFHRQGARVSGYDRTQTRLTKDLEQEGISIHYVDHPDHVPSGADLYVYTPAIPQDHKGLQYIRRNNLPLYKRSQILGMLSEQYLTIAVAGTHGKTTISSMVAHLLLQCGIPANAFVGGVSVNLQSNYHYDPDARVMVVEADEYDRSFLRLSPHHALISAVDADHLDIYGSGEKLHRAFVQFLERINPRGTALIHEEVSLSGPAGLPVETYGRSTQSNYYVKNIRKENGQMCFDASMNGEQVKGISLAMPGAYNVENALAAMALVCRLGPSPQEVAKALSAYKGVKRRFEIRVHSPQQVYIDDYAHHPQEIKACIEAAKEFFPGRELTVAFQPHLYSRTRDFYKGFAQSLELADKVILLEIYPAREKPVPGVSAQMILNELSPGKGRVLKDSLLPEYVRKSRPPLFMTLGAGDIDRLTGPIAQQMERQTRQNSNDDDEK